MKSCLVDLLVMQLIDFTFYKAKCMPNPTIQKSSDIQAFPAAYRLYTFLFMLTCRKTILHTPKTAMK